LAQAACVVGLLFAAVSVYWGLGGTWLLDTTNESIERSARAGETGVYIAVWAAAVLKLMAAVLPWLALRPLQNPTWSRRVWVLAWAAAAITTIYGLLATTLAQLTLHDVINASAVDDRRHVWLAFVWEPWFLVWGLMIGAALLRGRHRAPGSRGRRS
jgi:hypothetical protein